MESRLRPEEKPWRLALSLWLLLRELPSVPHYLGIVIHWHKDTSHILLMVIRLCIELRKFLMRRVLMKMSGTFDLPSDK